MGKSSKAPPPDPRLVDAQLRSMGMQDAAIQQVMDLARQQQEDNRALMPLQREALQFGLDTGRQAWDQSQSDRGWLLGRRESLSGLQDQMVGEANAFNSPAEQERRAAAAQAQVGQAVSQSQEAAARQMASMGIAPNSGRMADMMRKSGIDAARVGVGAANAARMDARNEGRMLTDRASNALAGYPSMAMGATGQGAGLGMNQISAANMGAGGINAGYGAMTGAQQAAGGLAGSMGANATGMYGAQGQLWQQSQNSRNQLLGGLFGGAATLGGAALGAPGFWKWATSAREYKQDIERIGTHALGFGVYRFRYRPEMRAKGGDGFFFGVMADEVAEVLPEAVGVDADGHTVVDYSML